MPPQKYTRFSSRANNRMPPQQNDQILEDSTAKDDKMEIGDQLYTWVSFLGVPFLMQQHGIVVNVEPEWIHMVLVQKKETENVEEAPEETISDTIEFCLRREKISLDEARTSWHKIPYGVPWTKRLFKRAGTANPTLADPPSVALSRLAFLWRHESTLLRNLPIEATNEKDISECIVVWCKTGDFRSFHGLAKMGHNGADLGSSASMAGSVVTQVVASSVAPFMIPVFAVYDVAIAVHSLRATKKCETEWTQISDDWNEQYITAQALRDTQSM